MAEDFPHPPHIMLLLSSFIDSGLPNCSFHEEFFYALVPTVMLLMKEVLHQSTSFTLCHYLVSFCKYGDMKGTNRKIIDLGKSSFLKDPLESSELMKASAKCIHNSRAACFYLEWRLLLRKLMKNHNNMELYVWQKLDE